MSRYFHRTDAAEAIMREGFMDATGSYGFTWTTLTGIFVSDSPLDINEGAGGEVLLELTCSDDLDLSDFEIVDLSGHSGYREWCVPAALLNTRFDVRVVSQDEEDALYLEGL